MESTNGRIWNGPLVLFLFNGKVANEHYACEKSQQIV